MHRPKTATISEAGRTEDDIESIGSFEHQFQLKRNYRRVVKLLISNGVPQYDSSCPYILSGKHKSVYIIDTVCMVCIAIATLTQQ